MEVIYSFAKFLYTVCKYKMNPILDLALYNKIKFLIKEKLLPSSVRSV